MRFADYIALAFRNIRRQKLRSALTIFAIVIGATSVTIMLALVFSLKGFMTKQFEENGTFQQIQVSQQTDLDWGDYTSNGDCTSCVKLTDDLAKQMATEAHVTGVARQTYVGMFSALTYGSQKLRIGQITAYDSNGVINSNVLAGRDIKNDDPDGVITITSDYADKLGFKKHYQGLIGKQVTLTSRDWYTGVGSDPVKQMADQQAWYNSHPDTNGQDYHPAPVELTAKIVGVTSADMQGMAIRVPMHWAHGMQDNRRMEVTKEAQDAAQAKCRNVRGPCSTQPQPVLTVTNGIDQNGYNSFMVKVDKASNASGVAHNLRNKYKVGAVDAQTEIKKQLGIFDILGAVLGGIGGIALAVAAVGVVNTMIMAILERTREIGVMRAVGAKRGTVSRLFTFEASLLGFMGGVLGLGVGYALVLIANPLINKQLQDNGIVSRNIIALPLWLILSVIVITTLIGMLAGLYPARRAARLDPVEALRYE